MAEGSKKAQVAKHAVRFVVVFVTSVTAIFVLTWLLSGGPVTKIWAGLFGVYFFFAKQQCAREHFAQFV